MTTAVSLEIPLEAQGMQPNFRYDILQPLLQGRVPLEGITLKPSGPTEQAGYFDNPKFKNGEFGLLDTNWGDVIPAIEAGWDMVLLPVFIKRKPVYNFLWVRADRGIDTPKDLEGKTFATVGYGSAISTYTRGFLKDFYGVNINTFKWLSGGPNRFEVYAKDIAIEFATGPRKSPVQRLLDGEADASTGDITDAQAWKTLESTPTVKRMFPDYVDLNRKLWQEKGIFTPVHIIVMGGKLNREHPDLARRLYDAFVQSKELAYSDALGEGTSYSMLFAMRETMRDQLGTLGDMYPYGIKANQGTIDMFLDYNVQQGLTKNRMTVDQIFAKGALDT